MSIAALLASIPGLKADYKTDWKEDAKADWKVDWDAASGPGSDPVNTVAPAVSGTTTVGQTLTTTNGTWTGVPTPTFTRQWMRDGVAIVGATNTTYVLVADDVDALISCVVTATSAAGSATAESNEVGPVIAA